MPRSHTSPILQAPRMLVAATLLGFALAAQAQGAPPPTTAPAPTPSAEAPLPPPPPGTGEVRRAIYVPESVKAQLRDEIRKEVLEQARQEGWAAPNLVPRWLQRFRLSGDVRTRFDRAMFPSGNASDGEFPDFAAIDASAPFDVNFVDVSGEKYLNVDQSRNRPRIRARLAVDVDVAPGVVSGVRVVSGENGSPVSANQTLGGSGGGFSKYPLWLDRAFIRLGGTGPRSGLALDVGRFANPFFATEMIWSDSLSFDGAAVSGRAALGSSLSLFATGGAFPAYTSGLAFPVERTAKFTSTNKWLFGGQGGLEWRTPGDLVLKVAGALYDFYKVEGKSSGPCDTNLKNVTCDTDETRPSFAQKGNTYFPIRTPSDAALAAEALGSASRYQWFGLASSFREVVGTARVEVPVGALRIAGDAEYVWNAGFEKDKVAALALNNRGSCNATACGPYEGGGRGYIGRITFGSKVQDVRWSWSAGATYRRLESDAVVDAFDDADFGLGGTNLEGYTLTATLGLADGTVLTGRWMSADAIAGPPYRVDVYQIDLTARF